MMRPSSTQLILFLASAFGSACIGFAVMHFLKADRIPPAPQVIDAPEVTGDVAEAIPIDSIVQQLRKANDKGVDRARRLELAKVVEELPDEEISKLVEATYAAHSYPRGRLDFATKVVLLRWAEMDITAAVDWAEGIENSGERASAFAQIGAVWVHRDPGAYVRWVHDRMSKGNFTSRDLERAVKLVAKYDVPSAILLDPGGKTLSRLIPESLHSAAQAQAAAAALTGTDSERGVRGKGGASDGSVRTYSFATSDHGRDLRRAIGRRWRELDADAYEAAVAAGVFQPDLLMQLDGRVPIAYDVQTADAEVAAATDSDGRREALYQVVNTWGGDDLDAAGEWLGAQGDGAETWPARRCFARAAAAYDPTAALAWLETIGDQKIRNAGFSDVVKTWVTLNPDEEADTSSWSAGERRAWAELSAVLLQSRPAP